MIRRTVGISCWMIGVKFEKTEEVLCVYAHVNMCIRSSGRVELVVRSFSFSRIPEWERRSVMNALIAHVPFLSVFCEDLLQKSFRSIIHQWYPPINEVMIQTRQLYEGYGFDHSRHFSAIWQEVRDGGAEKWYEMCDKQRSHGFRGTSFVL